MDTDELTYELRLYRSRSRWSWLLEKSTGGSFGLGMYPTRRAAAAAARRHVEARLITGVETYNWDGAKYRLTKVYGG